VSLWATTVATVDGFAAERYSARWPQVGVPTTMVGMLLAAR